jgi:4a-hydroxytetrahydrobiopterin dehydratase
MNQGWTERQRPVRLERRLEFADYESTRDFLDRAAGLSERVGIYPDMSFGRTYVNITLHTEDDATEVGEPLRHFAREIDALLEAEKTLDE